MRYFALWMFFMIAGTAGFQLMQSAAPDQAYAVALVTLLCTLTQLLMLQLVMGRVVNGASRYIKYEWLANRAGDIAVHAPSYALLFVIDYFLDFKTLQMQPGIGRLVAFLAVAVTAFYLLTMFTGGFIARRYRRT